MNTVANVPSSPYFNPRPPALNHCPAATGLVNYLTDKTQAPIDIGLMSVLGSLSTLLQGLVDVERPEVGVGPTSLYTALVAESGERKSSSSSLLDAAILERLKSLEEDFLTKISEYEVEKDIHEEEVSNKRKEISKAMKAGRSVDLLKNQLIALKEGTPEEPRKVQLIFEDATPESIMYELSHGWRNASLISHEGGTFLNGSAIHDLARLNKLWSSEPFTVNRKSSPSFTVDQARLTISIMAQPASISKFMRKKGEESLGVGFWARFLVCVPCSTQGSRYLGSNSSLNEEHYQNYLEFVKETFDKLKERKRDPLKRNLVIKFSEEAERYWIDLYNQIESELRVGGRYEHARDHASKLAENVARIAALLSYFEQKGSYDITLGILMDAEKIALYFSDHFLRCFNSPPEYIRDIIALQDYLQSLREGGYRYIRKNKILQSGPSRLRKKSILDQTLDNVAQDNTVRVGVAGRGMIVLDLCPQWPFDQTEWNTFCFKNGCTQNCVW